MAFKSTNLCTGLLHLVALEREVGNERNLVHLVEKSVEISPTLQPHPLLQHMTSFEGNHGEIKEISGNLVRQNCSLPTPRSRAIDDLEVGLDKLGLQVKGHIFQYGLSDPAHLSWPHEACGPPSLQ